MIKRRRVRVKKKTGIKKKKNGEKQLLGRGHGVCLVGEICQSSSRIPGEEQYPLQHSAPVLVYYLGPLLCFLQRRVTTIRSPCCHFLTLCSRRKAAAISVYISEYGGARTDGAEQNGPRTVPTAHDQVLLEPKSGAESATRRNGIAMFKKRTAPGSFSC